MTAIERVREALRRLEVAEAMARDAGRRDESSWRFYDRGMARAFNLAIDEVRTALKESRSAIARRL